jgi:hypothetical protein
MLTDLVEASEKPASESLHVKVRRLRFLGGERASLWLEENLEPASESLPPHCFRRLFRSYISECNEASSAACGPKESSAAKSLDILSSCSSSLVASSTLVCTCPTEPSSISRSCSSRECLCFRSLDSSDGRCFPRAASLMPSFSQKCSIVISLATDLTSACGSEVGSVRLGVFLLRLPLILDGLPLFELHSFFPSTWLLLAWTASFRSLPGTFSVMLSESASSLLLTISSDSLVSSSSSSLIESSSEVLSSFGFSGGVVPCTFEACERQACVI